MEVFACKSYGEFMRDYQQVVLAARGGGGVFLCTEGSFLAY